MLPCAPFLLAGMQIIVGAGQSYSPHATTSSNAFVEIRSPGAFIGGRYGSGYAIDSRFRLIFVGPIRTGLGLQFTQLPAEIHNVPSSAYVRVQSTTQRAYGLAIADIGIGRYDRSYLRGLVASGVAHTPTDIDTTLFDRPDRLDHQARDRGTVRFSGIGLEARLQPIKYVALSGSALFFRGHDARIPRDIIRINIGFSL